MLFAGAIVYFVAVVTRHGLRGELSLVGLAATTGRMADMVVAFLGDGRWEWVKHLVLANAQFDYALIAFLGPLVLRVRFKGSTDTAP